MTLTFVDTLDDIDWLEDDASGLEFLLAIALTNAVIESWDSLKWIYFVKYFKDSNVLKKSTLLPWYISWWNLFEVKNS